MLRRYVQQQLQTLLKEIVVNRNLADTSVHISLSLLPMMVKKKKKLHSIFTIKRIIVPSAYGLVHGGRSSRQLVGGNRYPAAPLYWEWAL